MAHKAQVGGDDRPPSCCGVALGAILWETVKGGRTATTAMMATGTTTSAMMGPMNSATFRGMMTGRSLAGGGGGG